MSDRANPASPMDDINELVSAASQQYKVDPALLKGLLFQESDHFSPDVISGERLSKRGAIGIGQFMPDTAKQIGIDPTDPTQSVFGAAYYLKKKIDQFGDVSKGLAAYNYGEGNLGKLIDTHGDDWADHLPKETNDYLQKIAGHTQRFDSEFAKPSTPDATPPLDSAPVANKDTGVLSDVKTADAMINNGPNLILQKLLAQKADEQVGPDRPGPTVNKQMQLLAAQNAPEIRGAEQSASALDQLPEPKRTFTEKLNTDPGEAIGDVAASPFKGLGGSYNALVIMANKGISALPIVGDGLVSLAKGSSSTDMQDAWFRNFVDPLVKNQGSFALSADSTLPERLGNSLGNVAGIMSQVILTAPAGAATSSAELAELTMAKLFGNTASQAARAAVLPGLSQAAETMQKVGEVTNGDVAKMATAGAATYLTNAVQFMMPAAAANATGLVTKMGTGAAGMASASEASRSAMNMFVPPELQTKFDPEQTAEAAMLGGLMAPVFAHGQAANLPKRNGLEYNAAMAEATRRAAVYSPDPTFAPTVDDIASAPDIDSAITAAKSVSESTKPGNRPAEDVDPIIAELDAAKPELAQAVPETRTSDGKDSVSEDGPRADTPALETGPKPLWTNADESQLNAAQLQAGELAKQHMTDPANPSLLARTDAALNVAEDLLDKKNNSTIATTPAEIANRRSVADFANAAESKPDPIVKPPSAATETGISPERTPIPLPDVSNDGAAPNLVDYKSPTGDMRTFSTKNAATLFQRGQKLGGYVPREINGAWVLSREGGLSDAGREADTAMKAAKLSETAKSEDGLFKLPNHEQNDVQATLSSFDQELGPRLHKQAALDEVQLANDQRTKDNENETTALAERQANPEDRQGSTARIAGDSPQARQTDPGREGSGDEVNATETRSDERRDVAQSGHQSREAAQSSAAGVESQAANKTHADYLRETSRQTADKPDAIARQTPERLVNMHSQPEAEPIVGNASTEGTVQPRTMFSRRESIEHEDAKAAAAVIGRKWTKSPAIEVHKDFTTAPESLQRHIEAKGATDTKGAWHEDHIHIFSHNIEDVHDLERTIVHEARHFGLDGLFGNGLKPTLMEIYLKDRGIRDEANRLSKQFGLSKSDAVNEALANFPLDAAKKLSSWPKLVGKIKTWLSDHGFAKMSAALDGPAADQITKDLLYQIEHFVRTGKRQETTLSRPAYSDGDDSAPPAKPAEPGMLAKSRNVVDHLVQDALMKVAPMSAGRTAADPIRAIAKDYANADRAARYRGIEFTDRIKKFSPEDRESMWNAADEENDLRREGRTSQTEGINRLPSEQRAIVNEMHEYGQRLFDAAIDKGMISADSGVHYWTPRVAAMITPDGEFERLPGENAGAKGGTLTSSPSLKQRKFESTTQAEAALRSSKGDNAKFVKDILTMPMRMASLERAIAGRDLVNQVSDLGRATGTDLVSNGYREGFSTVPGNGAFTRLQPRMPSKPGADGKYEVVKDQDGNVVLDRVPIFVRDDMLGPLKAITTEASKPLSWYGGLMALKGKAMGLIMYSPIIHNAVEWGRALPAMPGKVATLQIYFEGNRAKHDPEQMSKFINWGMVPIGRRAGLQDITGIMEEPNEQPGRSITAKALALPVGVVSKAGADAVKRGVDAAGDFWHNTLLWDRIGDLQMGLAVNIHADLTRKFMKKGLSASEADQAAGYVAAHMANRYAGALPNEASSVNARKIANVSMFSRTFTLGNLGVMKDMVRGLPVEVRAQLERDVSSVAKQIAISAGRRKAIQAFAIDIGLTVIANSILQDTLDYLKRDKDSSLLDLAKHFTTLQWNKLGGDLRIGQVEQDYIDRFHKMVTTVKEHPMSLTSPFDRLLSLTSNSENEKGKESRIHFGNEEDGTETYWRAPTGKIGEEFAGWFTHPRDMVDKKLSTIVKPAVQLYNNDKGFGRPIYDADAKGLGGTAKQIGDAIWHFAKAQTPADAIQSAADIGRGKGNDVDYARVLGPLVGITSSKGAPGGPAVAELYAEEQRRKNQRAMVMGDVHHELKLGNEDTARTLMQGADMTPAEIQSVLHRQDNPASVLTYVNKAGETVPSRRAKKFNATASDEEKERMQRARSQ